MGPPVNYRVIGEAYGRQPYWLMTGRPFSFDLVQELRFLDRDQG